ncbi:hypothetical protein GCM10028827_44780 [Mucilaginibacter myungsuensis]
MNTCFYLIGLTPFENILIKLILTHKLIVQIIKGDDIAFKAKLSSILVIKNGKTSSYIAENFHQTIFF